MPIIAEILVFSLFSPKILEYQVLRNFPRFRAKFWLIKKKYKMHGSSPGFVALSHAIGQTRLRPPYFSRVSILFVNLRKLQLFKL